MISLNDIEKTRVALSRGSLFYFKQTCATWKSGQWWTYSRPGEQLPRPPRAGPARPAQRTAASRPPGSRTWHEHEKFSFYLHIKTVLWIRIWIRIRIDSTVLDPDPYWECESRSRSMDIDKNSQINLVSCLSKRLFFTFLSTFLDLLHILSMFFMQFFVPFKVYPGSGSRSGCTYSRLCLPGSGYGSVSVMR